MDRVAISRTCLFITQNCGRRIDLRYDSIGFVRHDLFVPIQNIAPSRLDAHFEFFKIMVEIMNRERKGRDLKNWRQTNPPSASGKLRIIGGRFRGRQIDYPGDLRTRPMKDNIREALFNLVGGWIPGKLAIDLFAGSGAIGLEAISRGASHAILIERHLPTAKMMQANVASLAKDLPVNIEISDTFFWLRQFLKQPAPNSELAWAVFCSPPYSLFQEQKQELLTAIQELMNAAPLGSLIVVESDDSFDTNELPLAVHWRIRHYAPAVISIWKTEDDDGRP
jgi:16S rRNA (guanine(966)-N(2))-methyltransferase RsmD